MNKKTIICLYCGSYNFRADRSLAGRLVCNNCGNPYSSRKINFVKKAFNSNYRYIYFF